MGWLQDLFSSTEARNTYRDALARASQDGVLDPVEIAELRRLQARAGLNPEQEQKARREVIERVGWAILEDQWIDPQEGANLMNLSRLLEVEWASLDPRLLDAIARCSQVQRILEGDLPVIDRNSLPVQIAPSEVVHFAAHVGVYEDQVVARRQVGGSRGVRIRVARGVSFGVGGYRGHSVPIVENRQVCSGILVLTSSHVRYFGERKGFQKPWAKVAGIQAYRDGVVFYFADRAKASTMQYLGRTDPVMAEAVMTRLFETR